MNRNDKILYAVAAVIAVGVAYQVLTKKAPDSDFQALPPSTPPQPISQPGTPPKDQLPLRNQDTAPGQNPAINDGTAESVANEEAKHREKIKESQENFKKFFDEINLETDWLPENYYFTEVELEEGSDPNLGMLYGKDPYTGARIIIYAYKGKMDASTAAKMAFEHQQGFEGSNWGQPPQPVDEKKEPGSGLTDGKYWTKSLGKSKDMHAMYTKNENADHHYFFMIDGDPKQLEGNEDQFQEMYSKLRVKDKNAR